MEVQLKIVFGKYSDYYLLQEEATDIKFIYSMLDLFDYSL